jgi:hypothetical protein
MKQMAIFFALYLLALTVMPCADNEKVSDAHAEYHQSTDGHDHSEEEDFCSPLCVCNCCRTNITITQLFSFVPEIKVKKEFVDFYRVQQSGPVYSIWQPPKIA